MSNNDQNAVLIFGDGTMFEGTACGAIPDEGAATGEVVFNTVMSGYQEIISDPSYAGQIITFTSTQIGNYGVNDNDDESAKPFCNGVVIRDLSRSYSNWRANSTLDEYLKKHSIPGICNIDTRALTRYIRDNGAQPAAFGTDEQVVKQAAVSAQGTDNQNIASVVSTKTPYFYGDKTSPYHVVAYDFGIKKSILTNLEALGTYIEIVPWNESASDVLARKPDGIFLSNGPGDPQAVHDAISNVEKLIGEVPLFGICLGHQIMGLALKGETYKLEFGHHGGNHPVLNTLDNTIQITSQNHNYAVNADSISGAMVTHVNLNDGTVEGIALRDELTFSVQHHPEAGPGPHEAAEIFYKFKEAMDLSRRKAS